MHDTIIVDVKEVEEGLYELLQAATAEEGPEADDDGVDEVVAQVGRDIDRYQEGLRLELRNHVEAEEVLDDVADDWHHGLHTVVLGELPTDGHGVEAGKEAVVKGPGGREPGVDVFDKGPNLILGHVGHLINLRCHRLKCLVRHFGEKALQRVVDDDVAVAVLGKDFEIHSDLDGCSLHRIIEYQILCQIQDIANECENGAGPAGEDRSQLSSLDLPILVFVENAKHRFDNLPASDDHVRLR